MSDELKKILAGNVDEVSAAVSAMDAGQLDALAQAEAADGTPRKGVEAAIAARREALAGEQGQAKEAKPSKAQPEPWQLPDYAGALTATQAKWRNANIKPVSSQKTK